MSDSVYNEEFWKTLGNRKKSIERRITDEANNQTRWQAQLTKRIENSKKRVAKLQKALEVVDHLIIRKAQLLEDAKKEEPNLGRF